MSRRAKVWWWLGVAPWCTNTVGFAKRKNKARRLVMVAAASAIRPSDRGRKSGDHEVRRARDQETARRREDGEKIKKKEKKKKEEKMKKKKKRR